MEKNKSINIVQYKNQCLWKVTWKPNVYVCVDKKYKVSKTVLM